MEKKPAYLESTKYVNFALDIDNSLEKKMNYMISISKFTDPKKLFESSFVK